MPGCVSEQSQADHEDKPFEVREVSIVTKGRVDAVGCVRLAHECVLPVLL